MTKNDLKIILEKFMLNLEEYKDENGNNYNHNSVVRFYDNEIYHGYFMNTVFMIDKRFRIENHYYWKQKLLK